MEYFPDIIRGDEPCWYELGWQDGKLIWRVHQDFWASFPINMAETRIVKAFRKEFDLAWMASFDYKKDWGFGDHFRFQGMQGKYYVYSVEPPTVDTRKVSANHTVLTTLLAIPAAPVVAKRKQLLTVMTVTHDGTFGGTLGGAYSRILVAALRKMAVGLPENHRYVVEPMVAAMRQAYGAMTGQKKISFIQRFDATIDDSSGRLSASCPGDACSLHVNFGGIRAGEGCEFGCHNVDSATQQFIFLAGLGALHDLIRAPR